MKKKDYVPPSSFRDRITEIASEDPISFTCVAIVLIGYVIYAPLLALSTFLGIAFLGVGIFGYLTWSTRPRKEKSKKSSTAATKLKNIWNTAGTTSSGSGKKSYNGDKPFGSSYYYAHNDPNAKGGYKDGLKMEDYTMNGPRLLSKGGKRMDAEIVTEDAEETILQPSSSYTSQVITQDVSIASITKYQWDDPGDYNGIAHIRIDSLPLKNGRFVEWEDITVEDVHAELLGEGLLVKLLCNEGRYQLKIPKLYGDAAAVRTLIKPKRLLVRIYKKKNAVLVENDKANLEAWPQPYRKI